MANRNTVKSNIIAKNVPSVSNATLTSMLNSDLADNVRFREDVGSVQNSATSSITVDFTGKDRVDLTRTGGPLVISVSGMGDGEEKSLLITKTSGQAITFSGVTDVTSIKDNVTSESVVYYEIRRKGANYYAKAWVDTVKQATDSVIGAMRIATQAEANALSATNIAMTPGRMPAATTAQFGIVKMATPTDYASGLNVPPSSGQVKSDVSALSKLINNIGFKIVAACSVSEAGAIVVTSFENTSVVSGLTCDVLGTGHRRITHNIGNTNYFVFGTTTGESATPMYFGRVEKGTTYFDVSTGDDTSKNSTAFDFIIVVFNSYQA